MNDRVAVTGGFGLVGSALLPSLRAAGLQVVTIGRSDPAEIQTDLTDAAAAAAALDKSGANVVINLAALTDVDACEADPASAYRANVLLVANLARWVSKAGTGTHLIQISTDQVYGGAGPHKEDDVLPINYYAFSKYAGELECACVRSTVLRTNLFGRSAAAHRTSLSDWLYSALTERRQIPVFEDVLFSPLSLASLAHWVTQIAIRRPTGVYNLGARGGISKADFAFRLAETLRLPSDALRRARAADQSLKAMRPTDMRMDSSRLERVLGIRLPAIEAEIDSMRNVYAS